MADLKVNKVTSGNEVLLDLTGDTVTKEDVAQGVTFHDRSGETLSGSLKTRRVYNVDLTEEDGPFVDVIIDRFEGSGCGFDICYGSPAKEVQTLKDGYFYIKLGFGTFFAWPDVSDIHINKLSSDLPITIEEKRIQGSDLIVKIGVGKISDDSGCTVVSPFGCLSVNVAGKQDYGSIEALYITIL